MPGPMNIAGANYSGKGFFGSNSPGSGAQTGAYNAALQAAGQGVQASQNTTQAGQMQLAQQLQQQQAALQQNLTNRGLGNTTISQTMAQAPIQSYNLGMAQLSDLAAQRQMGAYSGLANLFAQGGNQITQTAQPYAQSNYAMSLQNLMRQQPNPTAAQPINSPANLQQMSPVYRAAIQASQLDSPSNGLNFAPGTVHGMY